MRETLYIRWRSDLRQSLPYAVVAAETPASIVVEQASLDALLELAASRRVVLFVAGSSVRLDEVSVPTRQASKVLQAVPYLLEEQLADDVETLHFAIGARLSATRYPVAVVSREELDDCLAPFRERGIEVEAVVPETLCLPLPAADGAWPVLAEPAMVTVRSGDYAGFSCLPEDLPLFLDIAEGGTGPRALRVMLSDGSDGNFDAAGRPVELLPGYPAPLNALIQHYRPATAINLLQGAYSRRENLQRLWRPWRLSVALLVAVFAVAWVTNLAQAIRLGHDASVQQAANVERFHHLFPNQPTSLALSLAIQQVAAGSGNRNASTGALLPLLEHTAAALDTAKGLSVDELQYHDHALYVNLSGSDLRALDRLRGWFSSHPAAHLDVQSANASGGQVQVLIKVTGS